MIVDKLFQLAIIILFWGCLIGLCLDNIYTYFFKEKDDYTPITIKEVVIFNGLLYQVIGIQKTGRKIEYLIQCVGKVGDVELVQYKDITTYRQLDCTV